MEELLTVKDVAEHFKKSERTIWDWVSKGRMPEPVKRGGGVYWLRSDIDEFTKTGEIQA